MDRSALRLGVVVGPAMFVWFTVTLRDAFAVRFSWLLTVRRPVQPCENEIHTMMSIVSNIIFGRDGVGRRVDLGPSTIYSTLARVVTPAVVWQWTEVKSILLQDC